MQFLRQVLILAAQFAVLSSQGVLFRFRAALLRQSVMNGGIAFSPPVRQGRGIDPLAAQYFPDLARSRAGIHFGENLLITALKLRRFTFGATSGSGATATEAASF